MTKLNEEHKTLAIMLWKAGSTINEIVDAIYEDFGVDVSRGAITNLASKNRKLFPRRPKEWKRNAISRGMKNYRESPQFKEREAEEMERFKSVRYQK